jgi:hypothetical protein
MPVIVDAISLAVRRDSIDGRIEQGWSGFTSLARSSEALAMCLRTPDAT